MNVIIFCKNFETLKVINNVILSEITCINKLLVFSEQSELDKTLSTKYVDFILTDLLAYESINIKNFQKNIGNIIVYNSYVSALLDRILHIDSNESYTSMIALTKKIMFNKNTRFIERYLNGLLLNLNFNETHHGTIYIKEAILYALSSDEAFKTDNLTKKIYPYIAEKYHKNIDTIQIAISRAIDYALSHKKNNFPSPINLASKNSPKAFILEILKHLASL